MNRQLTETPRLVPLYVAALARSVNPRTRNGAVSATLPTEKHVVDATAVDADRLQAFCRLMRQTPGEYVPSGFLHILAFPVAMSVLGRADFPLPLLGMIHLSNRVDHLRPVPVTNKLRVSAWVENLAPHRSGTQVDAVVEVADAMGPAWRGRSTYLAKGTRLLAEPAEAEPSPPGESLPDYPTASWRLGGGIGREYARISGDYNPIHLGAFPARLLGMKRPIAHGMYLASRMVAEAGPKDGTPFRWEVEFKAPITLPGTVSVAVESPRAADWQGADVVAWDARRRRVHFSGRLSVLGEQS